MAERQPMLSFAKVVSGQTGESAAENPAGRTASPPRSGQKMDHKSDKRHDKGERQDRIDRNEKHDRNFGNRRRPPKYKDRQEKRGIKPEPVKEEKTPAVEEPVAPQPEPVVLEPAPLPAVNAWFRNKGSCDSNQGSESGCTEKVEESKQVEDEGKDLSISNNPVTIATTDVAKSKTVDPEWPTLDAAKQDEMLANGIDSRQHSPTAESAKEDQESIGNGQKSSKGRNNWKKIEIEVDYGNKGKPVNSREKIGSKKEEKPN
ncbi:hypothetical protein OSTOST_01462, partial [Ostertagia ostertagi]